MPCRSRLGVATVAAVAMLVVASASAHPPSVFRGPGIAVHVPPGWDVTNEPVNAVTDPVQRFVLSSFGVPPGADMGGGSYVPPPRGVLAQLSEEVPPIANAGDWPMRPTRFALPRLGRIETLDGDRWGELLFREHGRHFYVFVWVGRHATSSQVRLLLRALDGMQIAAR